MNWFSVKSVAVVEIEWVRYFSEVIEDTFKIRSFSSSFFLHELENWRIFFHVFEDMACFRFALSYPCKIIRIEYLRSNTPGNIFQLGEYRFRTNLSNVRCSETTTCYI